MDSTGEISYHVRKTTSTFIMKLCALERFIEVNRQMICDIADFEPYAAFQRISRGNPAGISARTIASFLRENHSDPDPALCQSFVNHYDLNSDGFLSYKEFLDVILPKEHPELRAFVTQKECFSVRREEFMSYETEAALSSLIHLEIMIFQTLYEEKVAIDQCVKDPCTLHQIITEGKEDVIHFGNLKDFLSDSGVLPYESEITAFLRRVDRNGNGVISLTEFTDFMGLFNLEMRHRGLVRTASKEQLEILAPGRKVKEPKGIMKLPSEITNSAMRSPKRQSIHTEFEKRTQTSQKKPQSSITQPQTESRSESSVSRKLIHSFAASEQEYSNQVNRIERSRIIIENNIAASVLPKELPSLLLLLIDSEYVLNTARLKLFNSRSFTISELSNEIGGLEIEKIAQYLNRLQVPNLSKSAILDLFSSFGSAPRITSLAFANLFLPNESRSWGDLDENFGEISAEDRDQISLMFQALFQSRERLDHIRALLMEQECDICEIFNKLDLRNKGYIDEKDFAEALLGGTQSQEEDRILNFLGVCDLDKDGLVNMKDFFMYFTG